VNYPRRRTSSRRTDGRRLRKKIFEPEMAGLKARWRTLLYRRFRAITNQEFHMNHRHLILAYLVTWLLQLGYLGTVLVGWRRLRG
jgi:hypothetical protein